MIGKHVAADLNGCNFEQLNDVEFLTEVLIHAAQLAGATVLKTISHQFEPQGVTVLILLEESHISAHTAPEKGFAYIDLLTCGDQCDPLVGLLHTISALEPKRYVIHKVNREEVR